VNTNVLSACEILLQRFHKAQSALPGQGSAPVRYGEGQKPNAARFAKIGFMSEIEVGDLIWREDRYDSVNAGLMP
jgi:hypothetical protein